MLSSLKYSALSDDLPLTTTPVNTVFSDSTCLQNAGVAVSVIKLLKGPRVCQKKVIDLPVPSRDVTYQTYNLIIPGQREFDK